MFHFMFVHNTFSSVWVAELPPFGKQLPARLAICSHFILSNCYILNAKKPAPGKDIKIYEKNGNVSV